MNDFITLTCPSCGGKLKVDKKTTTYSCEFCGSTHKLRDEDIESFGRCPTCHRNDRVEKLTAILNKKDQLANKFRPPENLKQVRYFRLIERTKPDKRIDWINVSEKQKSVYSKMSQLSLIGLVITFLLFILANSVASSGFAKFIVIVLLLICLPLIGFSFFFWFKGKQDLEQYNNELLTQKSTQLLKLKKRYDKIYYCQRDDLLFIPDENDSAPGAGYESYLTKDLLTNDLDEEIRSKSIEKNNSKRKLPLKLP